MIKQVRAEIGLGKPLYVQHFHWFGGVFIGGTGTSIYSFCPISEEITGYSPTALAMVGLSLVWIVIVSLLVGLICAERRAAHLTISPKAPRCLASACLLVWLFTAAGPRSKNSNFYCSFRPRIKRGISVFYFGHSHDLCLYPAVMVCLLGKLCREDVADAKARGVSPEKVPSHQVTPAL